jgi:protein FAM32A
MGDYDIKPSGSLKLKGVKDKKIKKSKKERPDKSKKERTAEKPEEQKTTFVVQKTEAERRFEEIRRQRVSIPCFT